MTTNRYLSRINIGAISPKAAASAIGSAVAVLALAYRGGGFLVLAVLVVLVVEWWQVWVGGSSQQSTTDLMLERIPAVLMGLSTALIIALSPRLATQVAAAGLFAAWKAWWGTLEVSQAVAKKPVGLVNLLVVQAVVFEALFLMAAVWRSTPSWVVIGLVWSAAYVSVYSVLKRRGDRAPGVMAATWALVSAEISWVLLLWLFTYTIWGGYLLVPQPALVLTTLAYCFGSIYISQRDGSLSRARLTEYLLIGLILIAIVITGTPWRGSI